VTALRVCGDGVQDPEEVCDDGNRVNESSCPYGTPSCQGCSGNCQQAWTLVGPYCGDGRVDSRELCDDGKQETETACPYGTPSCTGCGSGCDQELALRGRFCGDGVVDPEEVCDDGNTAPGDWCAPACDEEFAAWDGIIELASGGDHVCARRESQVWCWGSNSAGQLGRGTTRGLGGPAQRPNRCLS
jgi:cysteine-rich repeat protein